MIDRLTQHTTTELLEAVRERLEAVEQGEVERRGMLPVSDHGLDVYRKLSQLLHAARSYVRDVDDVSPERAAELRERLLTAVQLLGDANLKDEVDHDTSDELDDVILFGEDDDDIVGLGRQHNDQTRTLSDLQGLYKIRLDTCRDTIAKLRADHRAAEQRMFDDKESSIAGLAAEHEADIAKYEEDAECARERIRGLEQELEQSQYRYARAEERVQELEREHEDMAERLDAVLA